MNVTPTKSMSRVEDGGFFQRTSTAAVRIRRDGSVWMKSGPTAIFAYSRKTLCRRSRTSWGTEIRVPICVCNAFRQDITNEVDAVTSRILSVNHRERTNHGYAGVTSDHIETPDVRAEMNRESLCPLFETKSERPYRNYRKRYIRGRNYALRVENYKVAS